MRPWFEEYPERLDYELNELTNAGYAFEIDENARKQGALLLKVSYPAGTHEHELTVSFPSAYPYFSFDVFGQSLPDGVHKNPADERLCILANSHSSWRTDDSLAGFLNDQVSRIVREHTLAGSSSTSAQTEVAQASGQFRYQPGTLVFTGEWDIPVECPYGRLRIGLEAGSNPNRALRGAALEVLNESCEQIACLDQRLASRYQQTINGRWIRLPAPPADRGGINILREATEIWPELARPKFKHGPDIVGLLFEEDISSGKRGDNWVFIVRRKIPNTANIELLVARADRFSRDNYQARISRLAPLRNKNALLVGVGALGSDLSWQLARAGLGGLTLVDGDLVQHGNLPRWQLGLPAVGWFKAEALSQYLAISYPFTKVKPLMHQLGSPADHVVLNQVLEGIDIIIDTTAEWCVNHYLSDIAKRHGLPYVWATGTPGGFGGIVGRIRPNLTVGCWKCFQRHLLDELIQLPEQEDAPDVQPVGCFEPTFAGSGFDMDHITLAATRLIVSTLCSDSEGGYPDFDWDIGIVDLWNQDAMPIAPQWRTYALEQHPECPEHG